jgi:hypothetical protein
MFLYELDLMVKEIYFTFGFESNSLYVIQWFIGTYVISAPCIDGVTTTTSLVREKIVLWCLHLILDQNERSFIAMDYGMFF